MNYIKYQRAPNKEIEKKELDLYFLVISSFCGTGVCNPNTVVTNFSCHILSNEENIILKFGLK